MGIEKLESQAQDAARLLKTLSNERRLMVLCMLTNQERNVGELEELVGLSQSALSQHLAKLRREGLVKTRREAQTIYYSINDGPVNQLLACLHSIYCPDVC